MADYKSYELVGGLPVKVEPLVVSGPGVTYAKMGHAFNPVISDSGGGADITLGITGAEAGQLATVKTVDENGVPTAWEASDLPNAAWDATVTVSFAAQSTTAEIGGTSFTKVSDKAFTYDQLVGAVFSMQGGTIELTENDLTDMSAMDVTGTMINVPGYGSIVFSCTEAGSVVTDPGFYLATAAISYAPLVTMSYTESLTASTLAIGVGDMEMDDGVTDLPTGVVWLQYEA